MADDVRVTRQRGSAAPEAIDLFLPGLQWDGDIVTMSTDANVMLEPGEVLRISILGYDELTERAVTSANGEVRLSRTVTARLTIADPAAGLPGSPQVIEYPAHLLACDEQHVPDIDPDAPGGPSTWIEPHDPLLFRFSERMGTIAMHGEVVGERSKGSVGGMDFRSFRGIEWKADGREHTAMTRNMAVPLEVGAIYKLQILGHDSSDARLPTTKDLSGNELSETFTLCFRTSHVRIEIPFARPYGEGDYRNDFFIRARYMSFKVTEKVKYVAASQGVRFTTLVRGENFTDPERPAAYDVELAPDGSGLLCVEALDEQSAFLGRDCLRVYEEERDISWAVVGREGGKIKAGWFEVEFGEANKEVTLEDGTVVVLPPSLPEAVEVEIWRQPYWSSRLFSLRDTYDVGIPEGVAIGTAAHVSWEFNPDETDLPGPAAELVLGTRDSTGAFLPYPRQLLLPWMKSAAVYAFSGPVAAPKAQAKRCKEIAREVTVCCKDQVMYECDRTFGAWCHCEACHPTGGCGPYGYYADMCLCYCDTESPACCHGCQEAISVVPYSTGCNPADAPPQCSESEVEDAKRKKCVKCEFDDCEDYNNVVVGRSTHAAGATTCYCPLNGLKPEIDSCYEIPVGIFCCTSGITGGESVCDITTPEWPKIPDRCQDEWQDFEQSVGEHENQHAQRNEAVCNNYVESLKGMIICRTTKAEALEEIIDLMNDSIFNFELLIDAYDTYVEMTSTVTPMDCNCE